jgi:hypothetical protein
MQSPERIAAKIENTLTYFDNKTFFFYDDNFSANRKKKGRLYPVRPTVPSLATSCEIHMHPSS